MRLTFKGQATKFSVELDSNHKIMLSGHSMVGANTDWCSLWSQVSRVLTQCTSGDQSQDQETFFTTAVVPGFPLTVVT